MELFTFVRCSKSVKQVSKPQQSDKTNTFKYVSIKDRLIKSHGWFLIGDRTQSFAYFFNFVHYWFAGERIVRAASYKI